MMSVVTAWMLLGGGAVITAVAGVAEGSLGAMPSSNGRNRAHTSNKLWPMLLVLNLVGPFAVALGAYGLATVIGWSAAWSSAGFVLLLFVVSVLLRALSLAWGAMRSELLAGRLGRLLAALSWLGWPVRAAIHAARPLLAVEDDTNGGRLSGDAIRALVQGDDDTSPIEDEEMEMITGIIELGDTRVREVMVPRIDIITISCEATLDEALDTIIGAGHSRIPVFDESVDDIVGLLYAKDLLRAFREHNYTPELRGLLREPYYVPQTKPVDVLLEELQTRKVHMAIVVDEYGGTAGLVTIEDLIEEIVGEIQDEYDSEEPRIETATDEEVVCLAGVAIDEVNDLLDVRLPTESADTLGGLVFAELGRVPKVDERVTFEDATIHVLDLDGRRIHRVRVVRSDPATADEVHDVDGGRERDAEVHARA